MPDQKRHAVNALRGLNYRVIAAGDSYNDTAMLGAAHAGIFFRSVIGERTTPTGVRFMATS